MGLVRVIALAVGVALMATLTFAGQHGATTGAKFGGGCLTLPEGYKAEVDDGPDFTVERIRAADDEHGPDAWVGLYTGNFPSVNIPRDATKQTGHFGADEITWFYWTETHEGRTFHRYEAAWVDRSEREKKSEGIPPLQHHLFITGTDVTRVQELKRLVEALGDC